MNSHLHQTKTNHPPKPRNKRLTKDQLRLLEISFNTNHKLKAETKLQLANQLRLPPKQVAIWYQNRRARHKTRAIEQDYNNIEEALSTVLAEKNRLQKEVGILKCELEKAHQMMLFLSISSAATLPSVSASSDDHISLSSSGNMNCWTDDGDFPMENLYTDAHLIHNGCLAQKYTNSQSLQ